MNVENALFLLPALRRAIVRAYGLELAERWRPYRSLAVSYLFASEYDEPASAQA